MVACRQRTEGGRVGRERTSAGRDNTSEGETRDNQFSRTTSERENDWVRDSQRQRMRGRGDE